MKISRTSVDRITQHSFLGGYLQPECTVLDFGANEGEFCTAVARRYQARVFAAEPVPFLFEKLRAASDRIHCLPVAIGGTRGKAAIRFDPHVSKSGSLIPASITGQLSGDPNQFRVEQVDVLTLEDFMREVGIDHVDLLKLDIEGAELDMIESASIAVLLKCSQITVEFHDYWYPELRDRTEAAKKKLQSGGFRMIRFTPNNKDILFINPEKLPLNRLEWFFISKVTRNINGFGRMLRLGYRKLFARSGSASPPSR